MMSFKVFSFNGVGDPGSSGAANPAHGLSGVGVRMLTVVVKEVLLKQRALFVHVCNKWRREMPLGVGRIHFVSQLLMQKFFKTV
jgi:hypothetical protein